MATDVVKLLDQTFVNDIGNYGVNEGLEDIIHKYAIIMSFLQKHNITKDSISIDSGSESDFHTKIKNRLHRGIFFEGHYIQLSIAFLHVLGNAKTQLDTLRDQIQVLEDTTKAANTEIIDSMSGLLSKEELDKIKGKLTSLAEQPQTFAGGAIEIIKHHQDIQRDVLVGNIEKQVQDTLNGKRIGGKKNTKSKNRKPHQSGGFVRDSSTFPAQPFNGIDLMGEYLF